jgi:epoxyqueuosine reductase
VQVAVARCLSDHDLIEQWGAWYLAGREPRWIRRNALVVLGNVGDPAAADVQRVLGEYLLHRDPILRVHAVWAVARLGLHHLMPATDPHPDVQHELQACR